MKVSEIAFTVNPVTDLKRARQFYEGVLGLQPSMVHEGEALGWVEYEIGSGVLALGSGAEQFKASVDGATVALEVEDFSKSVEELKDRGTRFMFEPTESRVCHMAGIFDPDGNTIIIHKRKS